MPPTGTAVARDMYPAVGWSNWFGGFRGNPLPSSNPYGIVLTSRGSTGMFRPFRYGVKFLVGNATTTSFTNYFSTFHPFPSLFPASINLTSAGGGNYQIAILYYSEGGLPPFLYTTIQSQFWPNTRKKLFFPGPPFPFPPLLSRIGPVVELTPYNRKGFNMVE